MTNIYQQRAINKAVMIDTVNLCKKNETLVEAIEYSIAHQFMWPEDIMVDPRPWQKNKTTYIVSKKKTYQAAKDYPGQRVTVLNFANNHSIGGAPFYSNAQEESLCRTSTLYPCLQAMKEKFYNLHISQMESGLMDRLGNADLIYTPNVIVMKTQDSAPSLLPEEEWYSLNVITSAAPELNRYGDMPKNYTTLMRDRIFRILLAAASQGTDVLILGAYGCGAFGNPPEIVSHIFMELLPQFGFKTVEFAVYCHDDDTNYRVFYDTIESMK